MPERAALIAALIADRPLCLPCIASRASMTETVVEGYLRLFRRRVPGYREDRENCYACDTDGKTFSLAREAL